MGRGLAAAFLLVCLSHVAGPAFAGARPDRGALVLLDATSGSQIAHVSANGAIVTAIADGRGGWFVGGSFTRVGGHPRVALAHLLPGGTVDPAWRASISSASGRPVAVHDLARAGSRLFVAGPFGRVGGLQRPGLAAVDPATGGVLRSWSPKPAAWLDVHELLVAGPRLLVARQITYPTPGITALHTRTGAVDRRWNAHLRLIGGAGSFNTLLRHRSRVYVAGSFHIAGLRRNGLVAVEASSGTPHRRFAPRVANCSVCNRFAVVYGLAISDRRLYVSGHFERIADVPRNGVAGLDPRTGAIDHRWRPARGGRDILELALVGPRLYLGGLTGLYALDARTGAAVPLPENESPRQVLSLAVSGGRLLVTGRD
jgi:trimeric autotransporter adhesin